MVSKDLLDILRCPACVREKDGLLEYYKESWLICQDCGRKYPIRDDIPVMLIEEATTVDDAEHQRLLAKADAEGIRPTFEPS